MVGERSAPLVLSRHVLMLGVVLIVLAPVYWMLTIGLKTDVEFSQNPANGLAAAIHAASGSSRSLENVDSASRS